MGELTVAVLVVVGQDGADEGGPYDQWEGLTAEPNKAAPTVCCHCLRWGKVSQ